MSNQRTARVVAHRGASADHPENTLEAFSGALAQGADWVELDVRLSSDGALVVHHDPLYPDGSVIATTPAERRPAPVPLLHEALQACEGMGVNVEIKNTPGDLGPEVPHALEVAERVVDLVTARRAGAGGDAAAAQPILVTSFDELTLARVRDRDAAIDTGLLVWDLHDDLDAPRRAADGGHVAINPWDPFVDEEFMERCVQLGLQVNAWTVDDPERIARLAELGVNGIITNVPAVARRVLDG
jgi:glycerophosphoryl diester phosphodiesterase